MNLSKHGEFGRNAEGEVFGGVLLFFMQHITLDLAIESASLCKKKSLRFCVLKRSDFLRGLKNSRFRDMLVLYLSTSRPESFWKK